MSISVLLVVVIDVAANEYIRDTLKIFARDVLGVHDREADLVVLDGLRLDIPNLLLLVLFVGGLNFEPAGDYTLGQGGALVVNLAVLNRLLLDCLPVTVEEAIVEVDGSLSNEVISEQVVEVISLNLDHGRSWEFTSELEELVDLRVGFVKLIVVAFGEFAVSASDDKIGVRERADIAGGEVESFQHVELNDTLGLAEELLLDDLVVRGILEELEEARVVDVHGIHQGAELLQFLSRGDILDRLELKILLVHFLVNLTDQVENICHFGLHGVAVRLFFLSVANLDATFEVADDFLVGHLARLINLVG